MGSLSNLYISQSYQSLIHIGTNNTASTTFTELQDGLGNSLGVSVNTLGEISASGNIYGANITGSQVNTGSLVTTSSFNSYTSSTNGRLSSIEATTASLITSSSNALYTASFDNGTRNLTFTKGDNTTFAVNIPDVSGSAGTFVTTSSFNQYTQSVDSSLTNLNQSTASQQISIDALNVFSQSTLTRLTNIESTTSSLNTSVSNINSFTQSAQSQLSQLSNATASYANSASVALVDANQQAQIDALIAITGSFVTSSTNLTPLNQFTQSQYVSNSFFATTGSNTFVGNQIINGNISAFSASFTYLQTIYESSSVIYSSGSNIFGDELTDVQTLSGSVKVQGSLTVNGTPVLTSSVDISGLVTTSSFNAYTQSNDQKVNSLINATASYATSAITASSVQSITAGLANLSFDYVKGDGTSQNVTLVAPPGTDITELNAFTASQLTINSGYNTFTQSAQTSINSLNSATSSYVTETESGSFLITASVNLNTITFTKGNNTTFAVTVNTGSAAAAFPYTGSAEISGSLKVIGQIQTTGSSATNSTVVTLNDPAFPIRITGRGNMDYGLFISGTLLSADPASQIYVVDSNRARYLVRPRINSAANLGFIIQNNQPDREGINGYTGTQIGYGYSTTDNPNQIFISGSNTNTDARNFIGFNANPSSYVGNYNYVFEASNPAQGGARTFIKGHLFVSQSFTASLQDGYAWVGNSTGYNVQVATSSFAGTPINTGSFATTASFNSYTSSNDQRVSSLETNSASVNISIGNINTATASLFTSASLALTTASFSGNTLTFTKGDNSTFGVVIPDVSGSAGTTIFEVVYTGENITKGDPLYISGSQGANPIVFKADAADPLKMPVTFVSNETIGASNTTNAIVLGLIEGIDLTGYVAGQSIYVAEGGGWSANLPSGSNSVTQLLGVVTKGGSGGKGLVLNPGPAQLPGLDTGKMWVGNGNNQPIEITTASFASSASFNSYTSSTNSRLTNIESTTASLLIETSNLETFSASALISISNLNTTTASLLIETSNLESFSSSALISLSNLNTATASLFTSASLGLTTASFAGNTLTFRKGDGTTFGVVIPDVSGSTINTGSFATTGSNSFVGNQTITGSLILSSSADVELQVIGNTIITGSLILSSSAPVELTIIGNTVITGSAPTILSSSFSGSIITNLTDTYTDVAAVNQIVTLTSASYAALASGSLTNPNTLYIVSGSTSGSITGATLGSNTFSGSQIFTGSVQGNVVSMSITSNTASMDLSRGNYFTLTLADTATTHISASNVLPGVSATLVITTGTNSSASLAPTMLQPSGSAYSATLGSAKKDVLSIVSVASGVPYVVSTKNMI